MCRLLLSEPIHHEPIFVVFEYYFTSLSHLFSEILPLYYDGDQPPGPMFAVCHAPRETRAVYSVRNLAFV